VAAVSSTVTEHHNRREGGSVDGTNIWYPPAVSGYIQYLESQGQTPDFGVQQPAKVVRLVGGFSAKRSSQKSEKNIFAKKDSPPKYNQAK